MRLTIICAIVLGLALSAVAQVSTQPMNLLKNHSSSMPVNPRDGASASGL